MSASSEQSTAINPVINSPESMSISNTATSLTAWLEARGVCLNGVRIEQECTGGSLRMVSTRAVAQGQHLVSVPASLVLSLQTASNVVFEVLLDEAEQNDARWSEASVQLMAVAYERSMGADSRWAVFFSVLPEAEDLPLVWSDEALSLLAGTGVEAAARKWRSELEAEYGAIRAFLHGSTTLRHEDPALVEAMLGLPLR